MSLFSAPFVPSRLRPFVGLLAGMLTVLPGLAPASAHAILVDSAPALAGTVPAGHVAIRLRFNSRIDAARSRVTLNPAEARRLVLPLDPGTPPDVLSTQAELEPGKYVLRWQVLAVDGHITRGDVGFTATAPVR